MHTITGRIFVAITKFSIMANIDLITREELEAVLEPLKKQIEKIQSDQENKPEAPEYLTVNETATLLKVSPYTVREWTKAGKLIRYRISSRIRYKYSEVLDALQRINRPKY